MAAAATSTVFETVRAARGVARPVPFDTFTPVGLVRRDNMLDDPSRFERFKSYRLFPAVASASFDREMMPFWR
ncbi:hypothetical protein ACRAVF_04500 [Bradyrhizobium oligotrophicum S58]